jgi:hypothetical protein
MNAYNEGWSAYEYEQTTLDNPYNYGTYEYIEWLRGFKDRAGLE